MPEPDDPVGPADREVDLVQAAHDGESFVGGDLADEGHHLLARLRVEGGDGLVGQEDRRLLHEGPGDGHALLLATGQGVAALVGAVEEADTVEVLQRGQLCSAGVAPQPEPRPTHPRERPGQHVLQNGQRGYELELLEDEAHAAAKLSQRPALHRGNGRAEHLDGPGAGQLQAVEMPQQRGLAGTGEPEQHDDLSLGHLERDVLEGGGAAEGLRDAGEADEGVGCRGHGFSCRQARGVSPGTARLRSRRRCCG